MIRPCRSADFEQILSIIDDGAAAYRGVIPTDRLSDPYMGADKLTHELASGVRFWGYEIDGVLIGVMGSQKVQDVTLIRHAYVRTSQRRHGVGGKLLAHLRELTSDPILIGTWAASNWAIRFYERHGFEVVDAHQKDRLLRQYWSVPQRQIETSVVLADSRWRDRQTAPVSHQAVD